MIPVIVHHGRTRWNFSPQLVDLCVRVPASIKRHLICLRHALVDLSGIDDEALSQQARLRTFLKALKYIRRRDLLLHLDTVLADIRALSPVDRRRLFTLY